MYLLLHKQTVIKFWQIIVMPLHLRLYDEKNDQLYEKNCRSKKNKLVNNAFNYLKEYCNASGLHGLRYLSEKRSKIEKIFWALILILSLSGCVYMISEILKKYVNNPVVISFATRNTPIFTIPFPAVTICPESKCSKRKFDFSEMLNKAMNHSLTDKEELYLQHISLLCQETDYKKILEEGYKTVNQTDFFQTITEPLFIGSCKFMGVKYDDGCHEIFKPVVVDGGLCYSFNILDREELFRSHVASYEDSYDVNMFSTKDFDLETGYSKNAGVNSYPRRALVSGADNSLEVTFFHFLGDTDYLCSNFFDGFRVEVHNSLDIPRLSKRSFLVPLNKIVIVAVEPNQVTSSKDVKNFDPEKRKCYWIHERPLKHFKFYTQSNCLLECITNYTLNACGCVAFFMPRDNQTAICGIGSTDCVKKAEEDCNLGQWKSKNSESSYAYDHDCDCKPSCTELTHNAEISQSDLNFKAYLDYLILSMPNNSNISLSNDVSILSIYFKSEQFMGIERNELYGTSDLLSNFGGLLGLFTGFSLISVIEIIYFLTLRILANIQLYGNWFDSSSRA